MSGSETLMLLATNHGVSLPVDIAGQILVLAGLDSQQRLRLVSSSWKTLVDEVGMGQFNIILHRLKGFDPTSHHTLSLAQQQLNDILDYADAKLLNQLPVHNRPGFQQLFRYMSDCVKRPFDDQLWQLNISSELKTTDVKKMSAKWARPFLEAFVDGQEVEMVLANPPTGLPAIENAAAVANRIVLLERGGGDFLVKAEAAVRAGAIGVIICNNDTDHPDAIFKLTLPEGKENGKVDIPVCMVSLSSGLSLKRAMTSASAGGTAVRFNAQPDALASEAHWLAKTAPRISTLLSGLPSLWRACLGINSNSNEPENKENKENNEKCSSPARAARTKLVLDADNIAYSGFDGIYQLGRLVGAVEYHLSQGAEIVVLISLRQVEANRHTWELQHLIEHDLIQGIPAQIEDTLFLAHFAQDKGYVVVTNDVLPLDVPCLHFRFDESQLDGRNWSFITYRNVPRELIQYPPGVSVSHVDLSFASGAI